MGFKSILKTAFPFISAGLQVGGPFGNMAAQAIGNAIGVDKVEPTEDGVENAITRAQEKDPEIMLKLRQAEQLFQTQMQKLGFDSAEKIAAIDAEDRASARAREIAVRDKIPAILAITVTAGFFGMLATLVFHLVPPEALQIITLMIGTLGSTWVSIITYYFGSSSGSAAKQDTINKIAAQK